jgi:uncharacterized membrane protein YgdD (TMEM256/DUF423 family)
MNVAFWLRVAAIWGFLAVTMGAFGAHGLEDRFRAASSAQGSSAERLKASFQTAAQYHMYCALALLAVGVLAQTGHTGTALDVAGWSLLVGSLVFSGSLYILAVTGLRWLGAITPFGGVGMMIGWAALALAAGSHAKP